LLPSIFPTADGRATMSGGSDWHGVSTGVWAQHSGCGGGVQQLVDRQAANAAMLQARKMRETLMAERDVSADSPLPAIVIVKNANGQFAAKPVVLGLSDGTNYEVLDGLTAQDNVVVGISGGRTATGTSGANGGGGGPNGG